LQTTQQKKEFAGNTQKKEDKKAKEKTLGLGGRGSC
jgi:hypothetical protein